ncbi:DUF382-domain-containing protein [Neoconidiobolus thromboides FSU 785]|nr:DUF382-domain-containing protein [Neoconidiobolus thromboides FSU 785]
MFRSNIDKGSSDDSDNSDEETDENGTISKKKLRKLNRMSIAELKQTAKKPEVVEWVDVTASDPQLLVHLKSYRNTIPIPKHWSQKRKYLQGKRGIEKPPFELPDFIKATGIMEMRDSTNEKEETATLKQKARAKMHPKMGKLDIDYQRLHDAFFRFQTKPYLTKHGELYYEGREFETKFKERKPGDLSESLKAALNMPPLAPPPWLLNMQRYGPPPSYPNLTIPGLNAPIPEGAMWGYHPGGWGKPPVDEFNRPLYGDVFGTSALEGINENYEPIDRTLWGDMESEEEVEEEEEEEEEEKVEEEEEEGGNETAADGERLDGMETPSTVVSGFETPLDIELRKDIRRVEEDNSTKELFSIVQQKDTQISGFMGSQYKYELGGKLGQDSNTKRRKMGDIEVALDPSEMDKFNDKNYLQSKYNGAVKEKNQSIAKEDLGDMAAEHIANVDRKRKAKAEQNAKDKANKFKF